MKRLIKVMEHPGRESDLGNLQYLDGGLRLEIITDNPAINSEVQTSITGRIRSSFE